MLRKTLVAIATLAVSTLILSGCQPSTVTNSPTSNTAAPSEAVDTAAIESEILRIENDWPRVMKERDGAAVRRVHADDVILVYPDGSVGNREQDARDTEAGNLTADLIEIVDLKVKVLDKDAAIATGRTILTNGTLKTPDGKTMNISGQYRFIDTFGRRNGQWKLEAGISTPITAAPPAPSPGAPGASPGASPGPRTAPAASASPVTRPSPATRPSPVTRPSPPARATPATNPTP